MKNKAIAIAISKGQYISDLEPFKTSGIPTNSILHKEITGCGITTFEIEFALHHSIIILPNVPVIESKVKAHNKKYPDREILGVYKGIGVNDIKAYLLKSSIQHKKILCTPEAFISKLFKAFDSQISVMYNKYFLLYDECDRVITDVSYRGAMAAPLDIFFEFENKALVSATTLPFSDIRFNNFQLYTIKPDYDYSKPLAVINTNNVLESLWEHITQLQSEHVCIFINSTKGILAIAERLAVKSNSKAYCAQESVVKLMEREYMNASSNFHAKEMAQYNFFTSRYFSAVDITLNYQPDVIIVSDIFFADHSIIDPHTEAIQIAGRFRNGINSLTHITNYNPRMEVRSQAEELTYLTGCLDTYEHVVDLANKSKNNAEKETLGFFIKESPIANFYANGKRNPFMIDNDLNAERVKGYYISKDKLKEAYDEVKPHFTTSYTDDDHVVSDDDLYILSRMESKLEKNKHIATLLARYTAKPGGFKLLFSEDFKDFKGILTANNPVIAEAVRLVGLDYLNTKGFDMKTLKAIITAAKSAYKLIDLSNFVYAEFKEFHTYNEYEILEKLTKIYQKAHLGGKVYAAHILKFFHGQRSQQTRVNVYILKDKKVLLPIHEI